MMAQDETIKELRSFAEGILEEIEERLTLHDFRVVHGDTHTNLIFDMVLPYELRREQDALTALVAKRIHEADPHLYAVITAEQSFV